MNFKTKENFFVVDDFYEKLISNFAAAKNKFLKDCNLTDEIYKKLMTTEKGKELLKKKLNENPELRINFAKLQIVNKIIEITEKTFIDYLPF